MKRPKRNNRPKQPIEQLALKYLTTRRTFARKRIRRRMVTGFGYKAADRAIDQMTETLRLCDPNFRRPV